jgi:hypothetical protein
MSFTKTTENSHQVIGTEMNASSLFSDRSIISGDEYDVDYLADYFPTLFGNPCFHGYVYIVKGQIVCMNFEVSI